MQGWGERECDVKMTRKKNEAQHLQTRLVWRTYLLWMQRAEKRAAQVPHITAKKHDVLDGHRVITEPPRIAAISLF